MLEELRIQNFAIIDNLTLDFAPGFNVITGETGAGKSILVDAVELLLGGNADNTYIRAGEEKAVVEGVFALNEKTQAHVVPLLLQAQLIQEESEAAFLTVSRELRRNGRSSSRLNGVTCNTDILREVGEALVDIHGQSAHLSLLRPRAHLNLLDRYADLLEVRSALAKRVDALHEIRRELRSLLDDQEALQRKADRLRYEVEELDVAKLEANEEESLMIELGRLGNSEKLAELAGQSVALLSGTDDTDETIPAVDAMMQVVQHLEKLAQIDPSLKDDYDLAQDIATNIQELGINLSSYFDEIEHDPNRLAEVEERMDLIKKLKKRYNCETIAELLAYADKARAELEGIEHSEERLEELRKEEDKTLRHIGELCERIAKVRDVAGRALSKKIMRELADLRMENARFEVAMQRKEDPNGAYARDGKRYHFDATGMEEVEFLMSANVGEPLRPLVKVASGGEAARIMLALKRVLTQADYTPTLIFDEIDQGIGGRIGAVVGEKLWSLTDGHQVFWVTHLPQLASFGDRHFNVSKAVIGKRTQSQVRLLDDEALRVDELAAMLGSTGESVTQSARDMLEDARQRKTEMRPETQSVQKKML